MLEISLAFFVIHVSVYDKDLDPMITLNKRFKTPVCKIFPSQGRCRIASLVLAATPVKKD